MKMFVMIAALAGLGLAAAPAHAQDYRARVQGTVVDSSQAALPGVTVRLINDATGVAVDRVTDAQGRYLFDFIEPGAYTLSGELSGFKKIELRNVRVQQRGDVTSNLTMEVGGLEETVDVIAEKTTVRFNSSSAQLTLDNKLIDQTPIGGRNPYNIAALDPTVFVSPATNENRPYHHAYAKCQCAAPWCCIPQRFRARSPVPTTRRHGWKMPALDAHSDAGQAASRFQRRPLQR
jgi:hypothetical protein